MRSNILNKSDLLIFVVGTSGSGKDSVMRETAVYLNENGIPAQLLKRVITRPSDKNEESVFMTDDDFLEHRDDFALSWNIFDNWYGCPWNIINESIIKREILLINVSRAVLYKVRELFPKCKIILITVPKDVAETRLKHRGREDQQGLQKRLTRMTTKIDMPPPDKIIQNTGNLVETAQELGNYLSSHFYSVVNS